MYLQLIKNISINKGLKRADVARMAGVSRAAVTKWFREGEKTGWANVETKTLRNLAQGFKLDPGLFLKPRDNLSPMKPRYLWDNLYPNMESFVKAVSENRTPALARLVQILGFYDALQIAGNKMIRQFPKYKKFIHPARRKQLELLWPLYGTKKNHLS